jgi:hypothetical protein
MAIEPQKAPLSRPMIVEQLRLCTLQAHRVTDRVLVKAVRALFNVSVLAPIYATEDAAASLEATILERIASTRKFLERETIKIKVTKERHGVEIKPLAYNNPRDVTVEITSPLALQYVGLLRQLDEIAQQLDALWMAGVVPNKERNKTTYSLQGTMIKLGQHFIMLERRARQAADQKGKAEEAQRLAGPATPDVADLPEHEHQLTGDEPVTTVTVTGGQTATAEGGIKVAEEEPAPKGKAAKAKKDPTVEPTNGAEGDKKQAEAAE